MNQASAPWLSHIHGCCSEHGRSGKPWEGPFMCRLRANFSRLAYPMQDTHIRERKVLRPSSLLLFCFFGTAYSSVHHRPILEEGRIEKMEFPDVSSFPCPSSYRGCGGWQFGNRMHHLMRPFHSSIINITEGSIFRPPGKKILKNYFSVPQGSAQILSGEEACVTCFSSSPLSF